MKINEVEDGWTLKVVIIDRLYLRLGYNKLPRLGQLIDH